MSKEVKGENMRVLLNDTEINQFWAQVYNTHQDLFSSSLGGENFVSPVKDDKAAIELLMTTNSYTLDEATRIVTGLRERANTHEYAGPTLWGLIDGFDMRRDGPNYGPCSSNFMSESIFEKVPTVAHGRPVFWIPRLLNGSCKKSSEDMFSLLTKACVGLETSLDRFGFGRAETLTALILGHLKMSGERVLLNKEVLTASTHLVGFSLRGLTIGFKESEGLNISDWYYIEHNRGFNNLGCFMVGDVKLPSIS